MFPLSQLEQLAADRRAVLQIEGQTGFFTHPAIEFTLHVRTAVEIVFLQGELAIGRFNVLHELILDVRKLARSTS